MKNRKRIQLDVVNISGKNDFKKLNIYVDGYCYTVYLPAGEYSLMLQNGVFIRDGKMVDSAGVLNTTETFYSDDRQEITL